MNVTINVKFGDKHGIVKVTQYVSKDEKYVRVYRTSPSYCRMLLFDITNSPSDFINFDSFFGGCSFESASCQCIVYHYINGNLNSKKSINFNV